MIHLAYDASLNGDWISHYAIRMATHPAQGALRLVHVQEGPEHRDDLDERVSRIGTECARADVRFECSVVLCRGSVAETILEHVPDAAGEHLVCGARARQRNLTFLSGTVSERLIRSRRSSVVALRVVQPGLLGLPRTVLAPLTNQTAPSVPEMPFLELLGPDLTRVHVLFVDVVSRPRFRMLSAEATGELMRKSRTLVQRVERDLASRLPDTVRMDAAVVISDDAPKEIVIAANRFKAGLIVLGATARSLPARVFYGDPVEQVLRSAPADVAIVSGTP